jgi:DNA methylase
VVVQKIDGVELNAICPYFTMFPLEFPIKILSSRANRRDVVFDPFCGRGTTNFAARILGISSTGFDTSPVAAAITAAKFCTTTPDKIVAEARRILRDEPKPDTPEGNFWRRAFESRVLVEICKIRAALIRNCLSEDRIALRAIMLGALHGPLQGVPGYFSNQCLRTFAPKPGYAVRYWREHALFPPAIDSLALIKRRATRYYSHKLPSVIGCAKRADSRDPTTFGFSRRFSWVITSPPYYGMRTYVQDQWLRTWFVGGPSVVDYSYGVQVSHQSPQQYVQELASVWRNASAVCRDGANLVARFGGIRDRQVPVREIILESLRLGGWRTKTLFAAGTASGGKRQANSFLRTRTRPIEECDVWAKVE